MKQKILLFFLCISSLSYSQKEASYWYFGEGAGIHFNTDGSVTPLTDGKLINLEGCAALSDSNGNLLFYTDGITVYNKNHQVMLNGTGLKGAWSSSQSATIVPKPGASNIFYVFTLDEGAKINGVQYSEIDLNLDGGLGGITANKNILVYTPSLEKISVIKHSNDTDLWIVTHGWESNTFYAHLLTSAGLSATPVASSVGGYIGGSQDDVLGYMKISPDGTKLAVGHCFNFIELFDFDVATGIVSNPLRLKSSFFNQFYGVEFSPNSKLLYSAISNKREIYQYNLTAPDIIASGLLIAKGTNHLGALQLGPNNKIYIANFEQTNLGVINNPDIVGLGCNVQTNAIDLAGKKSLSGLPCFVQSFFNSSFTVSNQCFGDLTTYALSSNQVITSATWDFGDGTTSTDISPTHTYKTVGNYTVSVTAIGASGVSKNTKDITISAIPTATKPQNILLCDSNNDGFSTFDLTTQNTAILNGQDPSVYAVTYFANATDYANKKAIVTPTNYVNTTGYQSQTIIAEVSNKANASCKAMTSFDINVFDSPKPSTLVPKMSSCDNTSVGTDSDGRVLFDLTERATTILNGQSASQFVLSYFKDSALTIGIATPNAYVNTTSPETIYVKMVNKDNATCFSSTSFALEVLALPTATQPQNLAICDPNNDGLYNFDLTTQNTAILNGQDPILFSITYFANANDYANKIAIATPNNYVNTTKYQAQTIIAEVSNKANASCASTTNFDINVFDSPKPSTVVPKMSSCDTISFGTDADGRILFDLTQRATSILNGQAASQFVLSYFKDSALTIRIATPNAYVNTTSQETIYVKMVNKDNASCFASTSFALEVFALPLITSIVSLKQCDDDIDGYSVFNLEEAIAKITTNAANETITFYRFPTEAQNNTNPITNPTAYTNQTVSNDAVYVRVTNTNECYRIAKVNLFVSTTQIPSNYAKTFAECDDAILGTNTDGIASFDFSAVTSEVRNQFPVGQLLDIRYFRNLADALAKKDAITDISNYRNIGYPNTQKIYIRVDSQVNNDCLGLGDHITLNVERIPIVQPLTLIHCDDDQDGKYAFDTTNLESQLLNGLNNVEVTYFDQNNLPLSTPLPNPFLTASQKLKVIVTNTLPKACVFKSSISFVVDDKPEAFTVPSNLTSICDDESDPNLQDGKYAFDTSTFEKTILGTQTGMTVKYFDANNNLLSTPLPNPFVTATQNVRVEVINPKNTTCTATVSIPFIVNPVPKIALTGDELVCSNLPTFTKVLDAGLLDGSPITDYSYVWAFNGKPLLGETNYTLTINKAGLYTVLVTTNQGCPKTRTFTVVASDKANITDVKIVDLTESNSITVSVAASLGDYVYSLDDEFGVYQKENIFTNVSAGIHTVYVKDLNGCGVEKEEVAVLGIPNFFTPNDDGYNDYWNIKGVNASFNAKSLIYIFDRYGKLIKQISPLTQGWDGTFNGQPLPATDYWYSIQLEDGRAFKGHFALKR